MKMKAILSVFMMFMLTGYTKAEVVLITSEMPPYVMSKDKGAIYEIIDVLFTRSEISYSVRHMPISNAIATTKISPNHCVIPLKRTQNREVDFKWISPLYISYSAIFTLPNRGIYIRTLDDAKKYTIGMEWGSNLVGYFEGLSNEYNIYPIDKDEHNLLRLLSNRIDLWVTTVDVAEYFAYKYEQKIENKLTFLTTLESIACNRSMDDEMIERLNEEIARMTGEGLISALLAKARGN